MNKLVLASLLTISIGGVVQAQGLDDCPCRQQAKKQKHHVSNKKSIKKHAVGVVSPEKKSVNQTVFPVAPVVEQHQTTVPTVDQTTNKQLSPVYIGLAAGVHHGYLSGSSTESVNHFTGRIFGGYKVTNNVAIEVGYFMMKPESLAAFTKTQDSYTTTKNTTTQKVRRQGVDVVGIYQSTDILPGLYGKLGVAYDRTNVKKNDRTVITGIPARDRTIYGHILSKGKRTVNTSHHHSFKDNVDVVVGAGYEVKVTDHLGINIDYTRYQPVQHEKKAPINFWSIGTNYQF